MEINQWTCDCGHINPLSSKVCSECAKEIPSSAQEQICSEDNTIADQIVPIVPEEKPRRSKVRIQIDKVLIRKIRLPVMIAIILIFVAGMFLLFHYGKITSESIRASGTMMADKVKTGLNNGFQKISSSFKNKIATSNETKIKLYRRDENFLEVLSAMDNGRVKQIAQRIKLVWSSSKSKIDIVREHIQSLEIRRRLNELVGK